MQYGYRDLFLLLKISAIYLTLKYLCLRKQIVTLHLTSGILYAGSLTYGVYLFHVIFMCKILFTKNLILLFNKYAPLFGRTFILFADHDSKRLFNSNFEKILRVRNYI